jgi:hypothetical protein
MMGETQYGLCLIVGNLVGYAARELKRGRFEKGTDDSYNERWLQKLAAATQMFFDAVSRNLERERFLPLVIGDGIQQAIENIAAFLQQHAGMHFTLGLVELAIFELPSEMGGYLVQPRILVQTKNIDRGIVTIENKDHCRAAPSPNRRIVGGYKAHHYQRGEIL